MADKTAHPIDSAHGIRGNTQELHAHIGETMTKGEIVTKAVEYGEGVAKKIDFSHVPDSFLFPAAEWPDEANDSERNYLLLSQRQKQEKLQYYLDRMEDQHGPHEMPNKRPINDNPALHNFDPAKRTSQATDHAIAHLKERSESVYNKEPKLRVSGQR